MQPRKAAVQVLPSATASQGPAADQRAQPFGTEECADATDDHGRQPADSTGTSACRRGEFIVDSKRAYPRIRSRDQRELKVL